jgi:hypothetical protein
MDHHVAATALSKANPNDNTGNDGEGTPTHLIQISDDPYSTENQMSSKGKNCVQYSPESEISEKEPHTPARTKQNTPYRTTPKSPYKTTPKTPYKTPKTPYNTEQNALFHNEQDEQDEVHEQHEQHEQNEQHEQYGEAANSGDDFPLTEVPFEDSYNSDPLYSNSPLHENPKRDEMGQRPYLPGEPVPSVIRNDLSGHLGNIFGNRSMANLHRPSFLRTFSESVRELPGLSTVMQRFGLNNEEGGPHLMERNDEGGEVRLELG